MESTIHLVESGVDTGPIIIQATVPIRDDDEEDALQQRIQVEEHKLLPEAARLMAGGHLLCEGRRVRVV